MEVCTMKHLYKILIFPLVDYARCSFDVCNETLKTSNNCTELQSCFSDKSNTLKVLSSKLLCTEQKCKKVVTFNIKEPFESNNLHACLKHESITEVNGSPINSSKLSEDIVEVEVSDDINEITIEYIFTFGKRHKRLELSTNTESEKTTGILEEEKVVCFVL